MHACIKALYERLNPSVLLYYNKVPLSCPCQDLETFRNVKACTQSLFLLASVHAKALTQPKYNLTDAQKTPTIVPTTQHRETIPASLTVLT